MTHLAVVASPSGEKGEEQDVFASRKTTCKAETTFLPRGQTTVNINTDPTMKAEVDRSIQILPIQTGPAANLTTDNRYSANVRLDIESRPIDTAINIVLRDGVHEYQAGSITEPSEKRIRFNSIAFICADLSGKRIEVIPRPATVEPSAVP